MQALRANNPGDNFFDAAPGPLEQETLYVRRSATGERHLLTENGTLVGVVRRLPHWWPALETRESGDEPLLFTLRRAWTLWPAWDVCDAEGERVGRLIGERVLDRWDHPLARRVAAAPGRGGAYHDPLNLVLAWWLDDPAGTRLTFRPTAQADPFLKMLLLAAVLLER